MTGSALVHSSVLPRRPPLGGLLKLRMLTRVQILTWAFQAINMAAVFVGGAGLPITTVMEIDPDAVATYFKV